MHSLRSVKRRARGFTLIELMIAVAIVAIIAAIAFPSYQDSVWKGKRGEAKAAITKALQAEERYYTQYNTYIAYATGSAPSGGSFPNWSADNAANSRYDVKVDPCSGSTISQCALVTATVRGTTTDPKCGATLTMDTIGNRNSSTGNAACWK